MTMFGFHGLFLSNPNNQGEYFFIIVVLFQKMPLNESADHAS